MRNEYTSFLEVMHDVGLALKEAKKTGNQVFLKHPEMNNGEPMEIRAIDLDTLASQPTKEVKE